MDLKQYEIVLVNLDPTVGSEIKKTRPCLVISPNEMNKFLRTIIVAPMTTSPKTYPTRVKIVHNKKEGAAAIDQIRTIDKYRIIKVLGKISKKEVEDCKTVIQETFVD
ncbi:MAG: type II toxin-antitoxin system PemK/MazF family toxin [Cryomorphaceae bacterium]